MGTGVLGSEEEPNSVILNRRLAHSSVLFFVACLHAYLLRALVFGLFLECDSRIRPTLISHELLHQILLWFFMYRFDLWHTSSHESLGSLLLFFLFQGIT